MYIIVIHSYVTHCEAMTVVCQTPVQATMDVVTMQYKFETTVQ